VITAFGEIRGQTISHSQLDSDVDLLLRPDDVQHRNDSCIQGKITRKTFQGAQTLYNLKLECGEELLSLVPSHDDYEIGDVIGVSIEPDHLVWFEN